MMYYLDIETTGVNELVDKIITIQYMALDENSGKPAGQLKILKEWDDVSDEKTILKKFISDFVPESQWAFVPIGFNLQFEHGFFWQRCISNGLQPVDIFNGPIGFPVFLSSSIYWMVIILSCNGSSPVVSTSR